jgi:hypothetical protein
MTAMVLIQLDLFGDHQRIIPKVKKKRTPRKKKSYVENKIYHNGPNAPPSELLSI